MQYHVVRIVNHSIVPILIDTGAACSIIDRELVSNIESLPYPVQIKSIAGAYNIHEYAEAKIVLHNDLIFNVKLLAERAPAQRCILGKDFLDCVKNYTIKDEYIEIKGIKIGRTKIAFNKIEELILATGNHLN